ncbi:S-type pyocin domain-containing protein [Pantoea stewartii]|uniref:S-type pyocin domain-containing protein n=1 Tax=Pantoea stewartii TaxID=66269 RepID=UPI001626B580|nr:S-type pyocin domain-containing protein [Pantoea stewartii]MBC0852771.1 S-type pyocin domain-containing protein [Pantoea stewartii]
MGGYRTDCYGRGLALHGDKTTTGATILSTLPNCTEFGRAVVRVGDPTTTCPKCGQNGVIVDGESHSVWHGVAAAVDRSVVRCGCPPGSNRIIAPKGQWLGSGPSPEQIAQEKHVAMLAALKTEQEAAAQRRAEERGRNRVFAKSGLRGDGCNDAGEQSEPHTNFSDMCFFRALPPADGATDTYALQHAQTAKKKPAGPQDIPKPKKRSALWRWWNGNYEEMDYQAAVATAAAASRAQAATAGASVLEQLAGRSLTYGTWAIRGAEIATAGAGASVAGVLLGMMPGRLNDGEQDYLDRLRMESLSEAPSRVRFTWENDSSGNPVPHGWHTPPGRDKVRVRKMTWDSRYQAYSFTTTEEPRITIIWTPDNAGVNTPSHTGSQTRPVLPNPVIVDPLPESTGITSTTAPAPAPEEKSFADYILILPHPDIPPIYIYIRNNPGQVTGKGQKISGAWLADAHTGNGSPIPSQIADRLRGRSFTNFDRFREAFWLEVARDPALSRQFKSGNSGNIKVGKAPASRESEQVGRKVKYEIHHIEPINEGGAVYDVDNMGVVTPKRHIDIHKGK